MKTMDIADPCARQLMARYLRNRQADLDELREALEADAFGRIRTTGHNLHGSGSAYGIDRISEIGASLESAARRQDRDAIRELIRLLESCVRSLQLS